LEKVEQKPPVPLLGKVEQKPPVPPLGKVDPKNSRFHLFCEVMKSNY
jgi:hypothetical protein